MVRIAEYLAESRRPLIWAGNGIRLAGEVSRFRAFVDRLWVPFVTTWLGADLLPTDHPMNVGIVGVSGHPGANKAVHECDLLIVLGSHLSPTQTGTSYPKAKTVVINIDHDQLNNLSFGEGICAPLKSFFDINWTYDVLSGWLGKCAALKAEKVPLNGSYAFNNKMTRLLPPGSIMVVDGGGTALYTGFQSSHIKEGSRLVCSTAISAMGSGLPEAVGAALARPRTFVTCLVGDGSLMFNLQELQTIKTHNLLIKIFILNNGGYAAIRQTQDEHLGRRHYGVGGNDLEFPDYKKVAAAFNIPFLRLNEPDEEGIGVMFDVPGPTICEWMVPEHPLVRQKAGKNLSEMAF